MMPSMGVMVMTTTATDCVWSFLGAAEAPEEVSAGSVELPEADMGLRPDAPSTGSLCQVSKPVHLDKLPRGDYQRLLLGLLPDGVLFFL